MAPQAFKNFGLLLPGHQRIGSLQEQRLQFGTDSWHRSCLLRGASSFTLTIRRWKMKRFCGHVFVSGLMLGSLLLQYDTALAQFSDTMPHFGKNSACGKHMVNPTHLGTPQQPFYLCRGTSGATHWSAEIRKDKLPYELVCTLPKRSTEGDDYIWENCSIPQPGNYRGILKYWVGTTMYTSPPDKKFVIP